jgi:hypothetical protein
MVTQSYKKQFGIDNLSVKGLSESLSGMAAAPLDY